MGQIGRNEKCPCGSGKKYKKCCGKNSVVSINSIIDKGVKELQWDVLKFAIANYQNETDAIIDERMKGMNIPERGQDAFRFMMTNWVVFTEPVHNHKRVIDLFIENSSKISRPRLKEILQTWKDGVPVVSKLVAKAYGNFIVEDIPTGVSRKVKVIEEDRYKETEIGSIILGIIVPMDENKFTYFTTYFDIPLENTGRLEEEIQQFYENNGASSNAAEFTAYIFPEFLELLLFGGNNNSVKAESVEWKRDEHKAVAEMFEDIMKKYDQEDALKEIGLGLWNKYCDYKDPKLKKPAIYAGALHYLVDSIQSEEKTQKEIAELYGVSASSMGQKYRDMVDVLEAELIKVSASIG